MSFETSFKLKLHSDFREMYDVWFDNDGYIFRRFTTDGPTRPEMINIFKGLALKTPLFGTYQDFLRWNYSDNKYVVVYNDIKKHCGEDKERLVFGGLTEEEKHCYLMEYIDTTTEEYFSKSTRYLFIGSKLAFSYDYISIDDWRSNCGDGDITMGHAIEVPVWRKDLYWPLVAVDFVAGKAVDLNISPGIAGVHFKPHLSSLQIVSAFKEWYSEYYNVQK
jgi:hypothetical protein